MPAGLEALFTGVAGVGKVGVASPLAAAVAAGAAAGSGRCTATSGLAGGLRKFAGNFDVLG